MSRVTRINWVNTLFLILVPIAGIVGAALLCLYSHVSWPTWLLAGILFIAGGLSITAGYHRLFAHKTYEAAWPVKWFFVLFGSSVFEGSVLEWSTDHRNHHRYTDTPQDPYNIKQGFWHAHMGWLFTLDSSQRNFSNVEDLMKSRLLRVQNRCFPVFATFMGFVLPTAIAALWGEALAGFIIAGCLRVTICHHGTFCINSLCHILGKQRYSDKVSARDNWLSALVTFGEGYHNYHHRFPLDYRNGIRFYQYDPSKWLIRGLYYLGLAKNLKQIPHYRIIQARVETHQHLMANKTAPHMLEQLHASMVQMIATVKELESVYAESKLKECRLKLKHARHELSQLFSAWQREVRLIPTPA